MKTPAIVPINFSMTKSAIDELRRLTLELEAEEQRRFLPAFSWHSEYEETQRRIVDHGLVVGWFEASTIPSDAIQVIEGLQIVFAITAKQADKFQGGTIDFDREKFVLGGITKSSGST
jgi:hypothetical protein